MFCREFKDNCDKVKKERDDAVKELAVAKVANNMLKDEVENLRIRVRTAERVVEILRDRYNDKTSI